MRRHLRLGSMLLILALAAGSFIYWQQSGSNGKAMYCGRSSEFWREEVLRYERSQSRTLNFYSGLDPLSAAAPLPPAWWEEWWDKWKYRVNRWTNIAPPVYFDLWDESAIPMLIHLAGDADPEVRSGIWLVWILNQGTLRDKLTDPNPRVRANAARLLRQMNATPLPPVPKYFTSPSSVS